MTEGIVVAFAVDDIAGAQEELVAAKVEVIGELVSANELFDDPNMAGFGWFFFRGPDGNVYVIQQDSQPGRNLTSRMYPTGANSSRVRACCHPVSPRPVDEGLAARRRGERRVGALQHMARSAPPTRSPLGPRRFSTAPVGNGLSGRGSGSGPASHAFSGMTAGVSGAAGSASSWASQPRQRNSIAGSRSISCAKA